MNLLQEHAENLNAIRSVKYARAKRRGATAPGTDVLILCEFRGGAGKHCTLFAESRHSDDDIATSKLACREILTVTGFTVLRMHRKANLL